MPKRRELTYDEFVTRWYRKRFDFDTEHPPQWNSSITCADATDLLYKFRSYLVGRMQRSGWSKKKNGVLAE